MTAAEPVLPEIVVVPPVATSVHAEGTAVPPWSLTTCLTSVRLGNASTPTSTEDVLLFGSASTTVEPGGNATVAVFRTEVCARAGAKAARATVEA